MCELSVHERKEMTTYPAKRFKRPNNVNAGVKPNEILAPDPLHIHYREENERLQNANEELTEKVRDLEETLAERDSYDDPCGEVKYAREKIAALRERFANEKKQYTQCRLIARFHAGTPR